MDKNLIKKLDEKVAKIAYRVLQESNNILIKENHVYTGNIIDSSGVEKVSDGVYKVIYDTPYATALEYGRLPGSMPPVELLEKWGERKLGKVGLGWPVAVKIKNRGTSPVRFLKRAVRKVIG